jgi:K+-sensing histidine kinase KdpD
MLSSWYGGLLPGLFAAFLSYIALDYYFIPPFFALGITPEQTPDMIVFVATALFISWLNGNQSGRRNRFAMRAISWMRESERELLSLRKSTRD